MVRSVWWDKEVNSERGTLHLKRLFGSQVFDNPKPEETMERIIEMSTIEGDLVIDFFAGSGTTAAAAHKMNRKWITIEQMDYAENITMERLKKVIGKKVKVEGKLIGDIEYDTGGISKTINWQGGGDFIYCELMPYNQVFMDKIRSARDSVELLNIWREMSKESFLNWYVKPEGPEEAESLFIAINDVAKQRTLLAELLDKNQLYVHFSEMEDEKFNISESDKVLNQDFYGSDDDA